MHVSWLWKRGEKQGMIRIQVCAVLRGCRVSDSGKRGCTSASACSKRCAVRAASAWLGLAL